jgi:hypothetical protein
VWVCQIMEPVRSDLERNDFQYHPNPQPHSNKQQVALLIDRRKDAQVKSSKHTHTYVVPHQLSRSSPEVLPRREGGTVVAPPPRHPPPAIISVLELDDLETDRSNDRMEAMVR